MVFEKPLFNFASINMFVLILCVMNHLSFIFSFYVNSPRTLFQCCSGTALYKHYTKFSFLFDFDDSF